MRIESDSVFIPQSVWVTLEPLIEAVRPHAKKPPRDLHRTISAIYWRHQNGAKWRSIPPELGSWWRAAQLFIRWSKLSVWQKLLDLVQQRGIALGMVFLDGTNIRAHHKAAGAEKRGALAQSEMCVKHLAALAAATAQRCQQSPMAVDE
jgi:transposase